MKKNKVTYQLDNLFSREDLERIFGDINLLTEDEINQILNPDYSDLLNQLHGEEE